MAGATVRRPSYKDVLQPALHRRFTTTALILTGIAYGYGILLGRWNSFLWSWFPIGPVGLRMAFLLPTCFSLLILRIAQYHVGRRTSDSGIETFLQHAVRIQTAEALFTYTFASYSFSQVYLWSLPEDAGLGWITYFAPDRARLNEKTIFFATHFVILGLYQGVVHLFRDEDRIILGTARPGKGTVEKQPAESPIWRVVAELPRVAAVSLNQSFFGVLLSMFVYTVFLRSNIWRMMLFFFRPIYNLPRTNLLPSSLPFTLSALGRSFFASFMLLVLLNTGNTAFSIFLAKEPLKNGKPLSSDSKDPNGSLLNGLKSKKDPIKCFAMWELAFIARDYEDRRKAIYEDIDRKGGPMWTQIYGICLEVLKGIESRIDSYGKPSAPSPTETEKVEPKKRTTAPPKEDAIFQSTPQKPKFLEEVEKVVNQATVAPGQGSQLSPLAKKALESGKTQLLKVQKEVTGSDDPQGLFKELALKVLNSAAGWPFRREYGRRLAHAVLGAPYGEPSIYINAVTALSLLAAQSLTEDKYGNVQRDVATIIRTLTTITKKLETFSANLTPHWTDISGSKSCPEVEGVLAAFKEALGQLIKEFAPYQRDLRLSLTDMRLAKEAACTERKEDDAVEMKQVR
ncbi:nucleoporin protein Ndc1-Nup [Cercophora newfieldiana]|uniref:Nucleoporin protein Ndc1-Nup n=1 Tax=Cercophora newfieldiana TaxID=92897 RepID=A0AA40CJI4_9PEZI|nr:nucleoporin protein Ndc1-Nup [Cercophora newfieldiana]